MTYRYSEKNGMITYVYSILLLPTKSGHFRGAVTFLYIYVWKNFIVILNNEQLFITTFLNIVYSVTIETESLKKLVIIDKEIQMG